MGNRNSGNIYKNSVSAMDRLVHSLNLASTTQQFGSNNLLLSGNDRNLEQQLRDMRIRARQSKHLNSKSNIEKSQKRARDLEDGLRKHSGWLSNQSEKHRDRKKMLRSFYELKDEKRKPKSSKKKSDRGLLATDINRATCFSTFNSNAKTTEVTLLSAQSVPMSTIVINTRNSTSDNFEFKISPVRKSPFTISILPSGNLTFKNNAGAVINFQTANGIAPIEVLENKITVKFDGYNVTAIKENNQWSVGFYTNANFTAIDPACIFTESNLMPFSSKAQGITSSTQRPTTSTTQGITSSTQRPTTSTTQTDSTTASIQLPQVSYKKICNSTNKGLITQEVALVDGKVDSFYLPRFISEFQSDNSTSFNYSFNSFKIEIKDGLLKFLNISNSQTLLSFDSQGITNPSFNGYELTSTQNTNSSKKYQVRNNLGEIIDLEFSFNSGFLSNIKILDQNKDGYLLNITGGSLAQAKIITNSIVNGSMVVSCQAIDFSQPNPQPSTSYPFVSSSILSKTPIVSDFATSSSTKANSVMVNSTKEGSNGLVLYLNNQRTASVQLNQREESKDFKFNFTINGQTIELSIPQSSAIDEQIQSLNQQISRSSLSSLNFTNSNGNISLSFATQELGNVNLIINKNPNNNKFNLAFYQDANPLDNFQGITEPDFIIAESLYKCAINTNKILNETEVIISSKQGQKISSYTIPSRNDQSSHYKVTLVISGRPTINIIIAIDPVSKVVKITNSSGAEIVNPGISVLGGLYPINKNLNLSISAVDGLYSCAYVDSRNLKIDEQCLTAENSFPPKPSTCQRHSSGFVIGNDLVTDFNLSGKAVYVKDFNAFLSAKDGKISLIKGNGEVLFAFNNSGLESNNLGGNITRVAENSYKLLDNQGNQLSLVFENNNKQLSLKLLKANGNGVQYNLTRDANFETYNIAGIVANQAITECSASQIINLPTTSTTSAQATTSTTSAQATTAELRLIQRTCNQTITDQHVQQNFYNDGDLFFSINASKNASAGNSTTSISFAIGHRKIDFSFKPSQTIQEIADFFKKTLGSSGYSVDDELNSSNPNQAIIRFTDINPANTSLIITKNSGNITYQLAVNGIIINQCNLLTTNIVEQIPEITQSPLRYNQSNITCSLTANAVNTKRETYDQDGKLIKTDNLYSLVNTSSNVSVSDSNRNKLVYSADKKLSFYNSSNQLILQFDLDGKIIVSNIENISSTELNGQKLYKIKASNQETYSLTFTGNASAGYQISFMDVNKTGYSFNITGDRVISSSIVEGRVKIDCSKDLQLPSLPPLSTPAPKTYNCQNISSNNQSIWINQKEVGQIFSSQDSLSILLKGGSTIKIPTSLIAPKNKTGILQLIDDFNKTSTHGITASYNDSISMFEFSNQDGEKFALKIDSVANGYDYSIYDDQAKLVSNCSRNVYIFPATSTLKTINSCEPRSQGVVQKTNGEDQFEVSKNRDSIELKFFQSNKTLSFDNSTLMVNGSQQLFPYNFTDNNFNYTATNSLNNLRIVRNDGLEILINETGVVISSDRDYKDAKICNFENIQDQTSITIFDTTTSEIKTSTTIDGTTTTTTKAVTSQQVINATLSCLENDKFNNFSYFIDYLKITNQNYPDKLINITSAKFKEVVTELKKPFKDDNEILDILRAINTSHCKRVDFIEKIKKIDEILKARRNQVSNNDLALKIAAPIGSVAFVLFLISRIKNRGQKFDDVKRFFGNLMSSNQTPARSQTRSVAHLAFLSPELYESQSNTITGIQFGSIDNESEVDLENGLPRRERGVLRGNVLRTLTGLLCLSNANGFHVAKQSIDPHGNILQTKNLFSLTLTPSKIASQSLDQRVLRDITSSDSTANFAPKGGFKFENDGFKFEYDQTSKNFILKDSSGKIKAKFDKSGEIIEPNKRVASKNPKLKLAKFGNMNVKYSRDNENNKMTMLDENKNGFQITFIGENILSSVVEEGRIILQNFNGNLIEDSLGSELDDSSNKIIDNEQSLISITQDQEDFEIAFDKNDVSIYSLINSLITSSKNQDFATRITMVSSDKLDVEEGYKLNPEIINKFLDSIYELSGKDSTIASYVESTKMILDNPSSKINIAMISSIVEQMDQYLQDKPTILAALFDKTQQFFIEKNQAETQAEIIRQNQQQSQQELISLQMQRAFSTHLALQPLEISSDLASSTQVEEQIDKQQYVSVAKSRIKSQQSEQKFTNSAIGNDLKDWEHSDSEGYDSEGYDSEGYDSEVVYDDNKDIDPRTLSLDELKTMVSGLEAQVSKLESEIKTTPNPNRLIPNQTQGQALSQDQSASNGKGYLNK